MKAQRRVFVSAASLVVAVVGCSPQVENVAPDNSAKASNESGSADASSQHDASTEPVWSCPRETFGANLVLIPVDEGNPYCIDDREVTYGEYKKFVDAKGSDFSGQPPECEWNKDYNPNSKYYTLYEDVGPMRCGPSLDEAEPGYPLRCVDFCDAWAYCAWSGKRLCGLRGAKPGKVTVVPRNSEDLEYGSFRVAATTENEWFNVCSQGGTSEYPYGNEYVASTCPGANISYEAADTSRSQCSGVEPPYDRVYNMSGGVEEWVNICDLDGCVYHAGPAVDPYASSCAGGFGASTIGNSWSEGGIRCCSDAVLVAGSSR